MGARARNIFSPVATPALDQDHDTQDLHLSAGVNVQVWWMLCASIGQHVKGQMAFYQELTAMRVRIPFVEALRRQQDMSSGSRAASEGAEAQPKRDISPKRMSDSYHRVVRCDVRRACNSD